MVVIERSRRTVDVLCRGGCQERDIIAALAAATGDAEHIAQLAAQRGIVGYDDERTKRARAASREMRAW